MATALDLADLDPNDIYINRKEEAFADFLDAFNGVSNLNNVDEDLINIDSAEFVRRSRQILNKLNLLQTTYYKETFEAVFVDELEILRNFT